jgi:hypothetical protein
MSLPPSEIPQGAIRFNTDSQKLEFYAQGEWWVMSTDTPNLGKAGDSTPGARGLFGSGATPTRVNNIDYITITSTGNATDFGDLTQARSTPAACSSSTRGVFGGGIIPTSPITWVNTMDYVTISSTGDATDFGDLTQVRDIFAACSSSTRGVFGGGRTPTKVNVIDYITISSTGNAVDFGDLTGVRESVSACSSSTRGVFGGGNTVNIIDFITIASTGDAQDFGDLTQAREGPTACSSSTRGVFGGGDTPTKQNTIDFITIASIGNATDFGDLTQARSFSGACSSSTRGVFGGGYTPTIVNTIDYITILSTGDAVDFGDLTQVRIGTPGLSNAHGGL